MSFQYTLITNRNGQPLSKRIAYDLVSEGLEKTTAAQLTHGKAERISCDNMSEFAEQIATHKPHQARTYGLPDADTAEIVTQAELAKLRVKDASMIARDREHFGYRATPSILFLDYDPAPGAAPLTPEELRAKLIAACPTLKDAPMAAQASSSSYIFDGETEVQGARGWHLYICIADGRDIPRAGKALYEHCWLQGHGRFAVSSAGTLLNRNLIDSAVWQPERLDFSGAHCFAPLRQRRPAPQVWNSDAAPFDSKLITDPTTDEQFLIDEKRATARNAVENERRERREAWITERTGQLVARGVDPGDAHRAAKGAVDYGLLHGEFVWITESGKEVTVSEMLLNPKQYHGMRGHDPLEPEYPDNRIARVNLYGGRPVIYSHAHGGRSHTLSPQTSVIKLSSNVFELVDEVLALLRTRGDLYDQPTGNGQHDLVFVNSGGYIERMSEGYLRTYLGAAIRFMRFKNKEWVSVAPPLELVKAIHTHPNRGLPILESVIRNMAMRADFSVIDKPGYHPADKMLYISSDLFPPTVPNSPTDEQIADAFATLWRPFRDFPFVSPEARGAYLAALLTAVVRPGLETAPGFLIEAPDAGSGKTLLAKCIAHLIGVDAVVQAPPPNDDEARKTLHAELRKGSQIILFDNWTAPLNGGAALCSFLTSSIFGARLLHESETAAYINRATTLFTGNNLAVTNDAIRRIVTSRLNADMEFPALRTFDLEPESYVKANQRSMLCAALTMLRGFYAHGAEKQTKGTAGSFVDWDRMVRQGVIWLGKSGLANAQLGDPYASAVEGMSTDSGTDTLAEVITAIRSRFGAQYNSPKEILRGLDNADGDAGDAIRSIDPDGMTPLRLGFWLKKNRDRWIGGMRIVGKKNPTTKNFIYAVEVRDGAAAAPVQTPVPKLPASKRSSALDLFGELATAESDGSDLL